jgi:ubiquitin-activating enzyme E1
MTNDACIRYLAGAEGFAAYLNSQPNLKLDTLMRVKEAMASRPADFAMCVAWARGQFEDLFAHRVRQLLFMLPPDKRTPEGTLFWSGAKLPPTPLEFDVKDSLHLEFIVALASLRAAVYGLPVHPTDLDPPRLVALATAAPVPVFTLNESAKIALTEEEAKAEAAKPAVTGYMDSEATAAALLAELPPGSGQALLFPAEFDKDTNSHMRVVAAVGNLRARCYRIPETDLHRARGIAGKIIPAVATTTALVLHLI